MSMPNVARNSRWLATRLSSVIRTRIALARSGMVDPEQLLDRQRERQLVVERRQVVHAGDVGGALQPGEGLAGLLHAGVQVADDGLHPSDGLALDLELEPEHAMRRRVLRPHVHDLPLRRLGGVVHHEVVAHQRAPLGLQGGVLDVGEQLLGALGGGGGQPARLLGAGQPQVHRPLPPGGRDVELGRGAGRVDGGRFEIAGDDVGGVAHEAWCAPLNWTGTDPTL